MESCRNLSAEVRKHQADVEMLKGTRDKVVREAGGASPRADATERKAEDAEAALRGAIEENFRLLKKLRSLKLSWRWQIKR